MRERFLFTRRVTTTGAVGFLAIALVWIVTATASDMRLAETVSLVSTVVLSCFAAGITLSAAARIPVGERLRRRWLFLAGGISAYAVGQGVRIFYEQVQGIPAPYPGIADLCFFISGIGIGAALYDAMLGVRRLGTTATPLLAALTVSLALFAIQVNMLLLDVTANDALSPLTKAVTIYQPLSDVVLCVLPGLYVVFAMAIHGGRLGWPWVPVSLGAIVMALGDAGYAWLAHQDAYRPGSATDFSLIAAYMLFALGALMHAEVDFEDAASASGVAEEPSLSEAPVALAGEEA